MLSSRDILCISSIDWDFIWQGHQEIMATLAAHGNRVLFIENTGVRAPGLRDVPRVIQRVRNWLRGTKGFRQVRDNLVVFSPILLPYPYSWLARRMNRLLLLRALHRWMQAAHCARPIVWTFLPTPLVLDVIEDLDPELTIYHCADNFPSSSPAARRIERSETALMRQADVIFVTSSRLYERARRLNPRVHLFSGGVDFERFSRVREAVDTVPQDLRAIGRPVIGYVGGVHRWMDQELLGRAAELLPGANFVIVGPCQADIHTLRRHGNIHFMGARPHDAIPAYVKGFDLAIVPYRLSEYTQDVFPTKVNEYLSMGIPVVATDLPELRRFNAVHGDVVTITQNLQGFVDAIRAGLMSRRPETVVRLIDAARQNDWQQRINQMCEVVEVALNAKRVARPRWQESLRRLYLLARRRVLASLLVLGLGYGVLFQSPLLWWLASPLKLEAPPGKVDAIVVLAGGVGESGKAGGGYQERVAQAVDLYHKGFAPRMVFSSGYRFVLQEAEVMQGLAVQEGVPASAILLETNAVDTHDNVLRVSEILRREGWRSMLLVSSPYHMRRAVWTFRRLSPDIAVIPQPALRSQFYARGPVVRWEQICGILHEYAGIAYYWWRGWL